METLFQYRIPIWHPLLVHFPIALVLGAGLFGLLWMVTDRRPLLTTAIYLQVLGFIGGLTAYWTGEGAEEQSEGVQIVEELKDLHENLALAALWVIGVSAVVLIGAAWLSSRDTERVGTVPWMRVLAFCLMLAAAILIAMTGHVGATMVWGIPA